MIFMIHQIIMILGILTILKIYIIFNFNMFYYKL